MRLARLTAVVILATTGTFAQRGARGVARPAPKPKGGSGTGVSARTSRPAGDQQIQKLEKMSPAERQKALEALPPDRRRNIESRLDRLQKMSPEERAQLQDRLERFKNLPPGQQKEVRQLAQQFRALPADRRPIVRRELDLLRKLPENERDARLNSPDFKQRFSGEEQKILRQSSTLLPDQF
ncbi:MAG: hypothetical protein JWO80_3022 [Bryobacterales bacterium]|nr:hypothetical protein [Bryobacterales bacterium]